MPRQFLHGWVRQKPDPRDFYFHAAPSVSAALPGNADNSGDMGPLLDQGSLGSCGPFSASECITFDQKVQNLAVVGASELFTYYNTRAIMGTINQDSGVDNRSMMKALHNFGFVPLAEYPYADDPTTFKKKPSQKCYTDGLPNSISNYAAVQQSPAAMQGALASHKVFIFGFTVYESMLSDAVALTGIVPMPGTGDPVAGGHDVTYVGYNSTGGNLPGVEAGKMWPTDHYKFRNHWINPDGSPWGDGGYGYIPYPYAHDASLAGDFWIINAVPGIVVPPPPAPPQPTPVPPGPTPTPSGHVARAVLLDASGNQVQVLYDNAPHDAMVSALAAKLDLLSSDIAAIRDIINAK